MNTHSHLWQFATWRFVCRGLTVKSHSQMLGFRICLLGMSIIQSTVWGRGLIFWFRIKAVFPDDRESLNVRMWWDIRRLLIQPSLLFPPFSYKKLSDLPQVTPLRATELSLESGPTCPALSLCVLFIALPGEINAPPIPCLSCFCPIWLG